MIKISDDDILNIIFELTHIKDEEGNDVPHFCFALDIAPDLEAKEEEISLIAAKNGYTIYKAFPGETMLGGLIIVADGATIEPVENMYREFYGEIPEISKLELTDDDKLIEVEDKTVFEDIKTGLHEAILFEKNGDLESQLRDILEIKDGSLKASDHPEPHIFEIDDAAKRASKTDADPFWIEKFDDGDVDFSKLRVYERTPEEKEAGKPVATFMLSGGCNGNGEWEDYLDDLKKLFKEIKSKTGATPLLYRIDTDIADDVWTGFVFLYEHPTEKQIKESLIEDLDLDILPELTDEDRFGDIEGFKHKYEQEARDLGATLEFHTKVGPKRLDSLWYDGQDIATLKYKDYTIGIFGLDEEPYVKLESGEEIGFNEFEDFGIYNDETFPEDYADAIFAGIEFEISKGEDGDPASSYGDLDFNTMWDLEEALDIKSYIEDVIPVFNDYIGDNLEEGKKKKTKTIRARDPNAQAMWGRTRHKVELPKKGKGSFKRHPKHKVSEAIEDANPNELIHALEGEGFIIESVRPCGFGDEEDRVHIQVYDSHEFEHHRGEDANIVYNRNREEVNNRMRELADIVSSFELATYSIGFGGTAQDGTDCTGRVNAGIDIWGKYIEDDFIDLDLDEAKKKENPLKKAAKKHAKTDKKGAMGWFIHPNVEQSIQHFNHVSNGSAASTITAPAGLGEDLDLDVLDRYIWEFDLASKYVTKAYKFDDNAEVYTSDAYWFAKIPETCMKVSRPTYKDNRLLKMPKNKVVLDGVEQFFKDHPSAKHCIIGCRDTTQGNRYVNAWRVLLENPDGTLAESQKDYWVLSDGENPKNSNVYSSIDNLDSFIADLESEKPLKYWELIHYVDGEPVRVWDTESGKLGEDLELDVLKPRRSPSGITFEARPREDFMHRVNWGYKSYPEFRCPSNGVQIRKKDYLDGVYMLVKAADKVVEKFFKENPRNQFCVLLAYDRDNKAVDANKIFGDKIIYENLLTEKAEKHDTLNPKLWDEAGNLKPEVREKIFEIVKEFTDGLAEDEIKFKIKDIVLVGSNCSYNYTDKSDLDIHIKMDTKSLECPDDLYPLLYGAYRSLFNNKMDIDFYGIPVEIYVETDDTEQLNDEPGEGIDNK